MNTNNTRVPCALMSRAEASNYLGISKRTLTRRMEEGALPFVRTNKHGRIYFKKAELDNYIKRCTYTCKRCS